ITTEPRGAPISGARMSPISIDIIHHLSPHARTPRVAQRSAYSANASRVASGIAPREWETRHFVRWRMGKRSRNLRSGSLMPAHRKAETQNVECECRIEKHSFCIRILRSEFLWAAAHDFTA